MTKHNIIERKGTTGSSRARANPPTLEVQHKTCPFCSHHKALRSVTKRKCAKCKREY